MLMIQAREKDIRQLFQIYFALYLKPGKNKKKSMVLRHFQWNYARKKL